MQKQERIYMRITLPHGTIEVVLKNPAETPKTYNFYSELYKQNIGLTIGQIPQETSSNICSSESEGDNILKIEDKFNLITFKGSLEGVSTKEESRELNSKIEHLTKKTCECEQYIRQLQQKSIPESELLISDRKQKYNKVFKSRNWKRVSAHLSIHKLTLISGTYSEEKLNTWLLNITHLEIPRKITVVTSLNLCEFHYMSFHIPFEWINREVFSINDDENQIRCGKLQSRMK